jgi:alkanesulfonate monooxygenase SsuD/methylene tetrahydromethanopterin reductase-like flavin-dependent oxidoreductase (luciferase family)
MTAAAVEQAAWADGKGFEAVLLPEHHASSDGYLASPFVLGAAIAARTSTIRLVLGAVLLALHNPLRVAEDAVMLDVLSEGRLTLAPGLGYAPSEFEMFGVPLADRARLVESGIRTLRAAFTGEPFEHEGRRARITPRPVQEGGPPIYICGSVAASARRAARMGDGFFPSHAELRVTYLDECRKLGRAPGDVVPLVPPMFVHVAEDPEKAWSRIAPHAVYEMTEYGRIAAEAAALTAMDSPYHQLPDADAVRGSGMYAVVTPEQCVELARRTAAEGVLLNFKPLMGGLSPDLAWESLELFVDKVVPEVLSSAPTGTDSRPPV